MAVLGRFIRTSTTISSPTTLSSIIARTFAASAASLNSESAAGCPFSSRSSVDTVDSGRRDGQRRGIEIGGRGRGVHWVFLGCPGVGKGTYASRLSNLLGVPHIATGDLVRQELAASGPLSPKLEEIVNQGKLVPDEIVFDLLSKRLEVGEGEGESGFILDGFPRTIKQAEILEQVMDIDLVVNLRLREEALVAKCLGRRICSECGGNFNIACIDIKWKNGRPGIFMAPLLPPPQCESKLITRSDDKEEVVKERLQIYYEMSQPVEEFYHSRGKLLEFDLPGGIPESWPKLLQALNIDDHDDKQSAAA